jgi:phage terminase small subunit
MKSNSTTKKAAKPRQGLNSRQERFCEFIATGECQTEAYIKAGFKTTKEAARGNAARLIAKDSISRRISELRKPVTRKALSARDHKREMLYLIMEDRSQKIEARLKAIEIDAKLSGQFEPDRTEIQLGNSTLQSIKERAMQVAGALVSQYAMKPE